MDAVRQQAIKALKEFISITEKELIHARATLAIFTGKKPLIQPRLDAVVAPAKKTRNLSIESRQKMADAQIRRWDKVREQKRKK